MVKYKAKHIAFAIWIITFKIAVIASLIYISFILIEIKNDLGKNQEFQEQLEMQVDENQKSMQSQINQISESLLSTKKTLSEEISELRVETSDDFSGVIQEVILGVVSISTDIAQGSGFIISNDGYIITNAHVLAGGSYARVLTYESNKLVPAELIGYDTELDIAILKISGSDHNYLKFGDSSQIRIGEKVIALGNPLGLSFSVTEGIVSATKRIGPNDIAGYIQIDVPLNRGNSGGPLINKKGEVIGINNFKLQDSENLGFALEADYAVDSINTIFLKANETIRL